LIAEKEASTSFEHWKSDTMTINHKIEWKKMQNCAVACNYNCILQAAPSRGNKNNSSCRYNFRQALLCVYAAGRTHKQEQKAPNHKVNINQQCAVKFNSQQIIKIIRFYNQQHSN